MTRLKFRFSSLFLHSLTLLTIILLKKCLNACRHGVYVHWTDCSLLRKKMDYFTDITARFSCGKQKLLFDHTQKRKILIEETFDGQLRMQYYVTICRKVSLNGDVIIIAPFFLTHDETSCTEIFNIPFSA